MICQVPFTKKDTGMTFPCGKCVHCLLRRISGWSFRLRKEAERSSSAFFVTLTYDTDHVPISDRGYMSLSDGPASHVTLAIKRLRKQLYGNGKGSLKYWLCGEYGGKRMRPHYHALLFNIPWQCLVEDSYHKMPFKLVKELFDGKRPFFPKWWSNGYITIGRVSQASTGYVLKYMCKDKRVPLHKNDDRVPEFQRCSKGIGSGYLTDNMVQWHHEDMWDRYYVPMEGGKKIALPRYYKDKIFSSEDRQEIGQYLQSLQKNDEKDLLTMSERRKIAHDQRSSLNRQRLNTSL